MVFMLFRCVNALKREEIFNDFHTHKILSISFCAKIQLSRKQQSFHSSFEWYRYSDCSIWPVKCWKKFHKTKKFHILWTFTSCSMLNKRTGCNFSCFWTGINSLFSSFYGLSCSVQWFFFQCWVRQLSEYNCITVFLLLLPGQCHSVSMTSIITLKNIRDLTVCSHYSQQVIIEVFVDVSWTSCTDRIISIELC